MGDARQFCTFFVDGQLFGVPVQEVQEVIRYQEMTRVPRVPAVIRGLINLRGQIVVAIDMRRRLNAGQLPEGQLPMNVVVRIVDGAVSLLVDEIGDVLEAGEENFEPTPETVTGTLRTLMQGVYKLPDHLLLVLDTEKTVNGVELEPALAGIEA
jgi:purine-binding chemotaxis protein CheW